LSQPHDEHPHVPGPSLWPVGFAVGVVVLLIGLIISWWIAGAGALIAIAFAFLWVRDLTAGTELVHAPDVPPESPTGAAVPADTGEAAMAPATPEDRFPRSKFLEFSTLGIGGLIGGVVTVPVAGFALLPPFLGQKHHRADLGPVSDFAEGQWYISTFMIDPAEGEVSRRTAFIRNNGTLTVGGKPQPSFTIISNRCAHLGCPVQPNGLVDDKATKKVPVTTPNGKMVLSVTPVAPSGFGCPCHGGQYNTEGNRIAGPPVRALDRYEYSIINGQLVLDKPYSVAHTYGEGKNAEIHAFELTGPGQHVDGVESWLYPIQPPGR
jgi:Rieske Fe-S protein